MAIDEENSITAAAAAGDRRHCCYNWKISFLDGLGIDPFSTPNTASHFSVCGGNESCFLLSLTTNDDAPMKARVGRPCVVK